MHEIITEMPSVNIDGISILVGTSSCNGNCTFCAGRQHRSEAPKYNGEIDEKRIKEVLNHCHELNCHYITLTGSGEPMLSPKSVTAVLEIISDFKDKGIIFDPVNIYTNGIKIGSDRYFCEKYLNLWKYLGLTSVNVSAYSHNEILNAKGFGINEYPDFKTIFSRIKEVGLRLRVSVILRKGYIDNKESFMELCNEFFGLGVDNISAWPLKNDDDSLSEQAPSIEDLKDISDVVEYYPAGSVRVLLGNIDNKKNLAKKIALFQNGKISDVWCANK